MWRELQKNPPFFISVVNIPKYYILVTDFIRIWEVHYSQEELVNRLKESNFGLEMDNSELLEKGLQILQMPVNLKQLKVSVYEKTLTVSMTKSFGFLLKLVINLEEGSQEMFFHKVTQPLLKTIQNLRTSECLLRKLIITKDDEIKEYQSFGGKIRYTAIPPYDDKEHMQKHCTYSNNFGDTEIPDNVLERIIDIPQENCPIKQEPTNVKTCIKLEPLTQNMPAPSISTNNSVCTIKQENIKKEIQPIRKRKLNL